MPVAAGVIVDSSGSMAPKRAETVAEALAFLEASNPKDDVFVVNFKRPGLQPCSIPDFVAASLCGVEPRMEPTQAAAFGALDLATLDWHHPLLRRLGLDRLRWPRLVPPNTVIGSWRSIPCHAATGDQQCSLAGALLDEGGLSINISTGSQVALLGDRTASPDWQTRPYYDGRFLRTITHIPGGRALGALVGLLTELAPADPDATWTYIERAAESVPSTDLRATVTFYPGPLGDRGALENLHEGNLTVGHLFRAVFESMASNYLVCARRLAPERPWRRIVFSGGLVRRSPLLRGLIQERLGVPGRLSPSEEDTLLGLLLLALVAGGREPSLQAASKSLSRQARSHHPAEDLERRR